VVALSILDVAAVPQGSTPREALHRTLDLAQQAERWGYRRFWVAEHHNMDGIASAAAAVVIGYVAAGTSTIRVGSGGVMLPNHAPLIIAEQFGTLESLYPGRIDLGLGRAPGTDMLTVRALRRDPDSAEHFPQDVLELQALLGPRQPNQMVQAVPGTDTNVPLWILGSSLFGAQLAAALGLPFAFASHFASDALEAAIDIYRSRFKPSQQLQKPYFMPSINVVVADTDAAARRIFTSPQQTFIKLFRGERTQMLPPIDDIDSFWTPREKAQITNVLRYSFVGAPDTVRQGLKQFIAETKADELMIATSAYDHAARLRSCELLAEVGKSL
jgi:luciferase family oxidoreductase group 1